MIRGLIVDDEEININNLQVLLSRHCSGIEVVASARSAEEARALVATLKPDVVFLDIEMPKENGFDFLKSIDDPNFDVVFVTAHDSYGIRAIKFSALDYLLKPISISELKTAVEKIVDSIGKKRQNNRLKNLLTLLDNNNIDDRAKIALPTLRETYLISVREIVRCVSSNNYTTFFLANGKEHLISKPMYEFDEILTPYGFIRCHQSHLVNKRYITRILNQDSGYLIMDHTEQKIPISRQRKAIVIAAIK